MCMVWPCHRFVDGHSKKCMNVYKKVELINHDCLPILILLYIMLYIMLAYLLLFAALTNAVCLCNAFFANALCFMLCLGLLTQFVYFKYDFQSCAVLLICWFFLILCSRHFLYERAMCSGEIALRNNHYYSEK